MKRIFSWIYLFGLVIFILGGCHKGFDKQLIYNRASRLHDEGKIEQAIVVYKRLLAEDPQNQTLPNNANIHYDLGMAYLDDNNLTKAREQIVILKKLGRDDLAKELQGAMTDLDIYRQGK